MRGRVIHSQYLQVLADTGYPGLLIYLSVLFTTWRSLRRVCRMVRGRTDVEAQRIRSMANGLECGLLVFCVAASFLSVELFELPYLMLFLGAQLYVVQRAASTWAASPERGTCPRDGRTVAASEHAAASETAHVATVTATRRGV